MATYKKSNIKYLLLFFLIFFVFSAKPAQAIKEPSVNKCLKDADCGEDKYCSITNPDGTIGTALLCREKKEVGAECKANNECKTGLCEVGQGGKKYCVNPVTGEGKVKWQPIAPVLQINIPTLQPFTTAGMTKTDAEGNIYIPFIGQYIAGIYKWAVGIAALIAVVFVIMGGFIYMTAGGNAQRAQEGKDRITSALFGLLLLLGSYALLYIINPDLVNFKSLKIKVIERIEVDSEITSDYDTEGAQTYSPTEVKNLVYIPDHSALIFTGCPKEKRFCTQQCVNALLKAADKIQQSGYHILLRSCYRSVEEQVKLKGNPMGCQCKNYNPVDCSNCPHVSGYAIDITCKEEPVSWEEMKAAGKACKGKAECKGSDKMTRSGYKCQNILAQAMREAGMCKLYFEDWHFQPKGTSKLSCF